MTSYNERTSYRRRARGMDIDMSMNGIMNAVSRKPEALLLMGAGLALLMRNGRGLDMSSIGLSARSRDARYRADEARYEGVQSGRKNYYPGDMAGEGHSSEGMGSSARSSVRDASDNAGKMVGEATEGMTRYASEMMRSVSDTASSYASSAGQWADDARSGLVDQSSRLAERARSLPDELDEAVQAHPLVLAALGVAIGAALGASLPATSIENRTLGEASDQMWESAEALTGRIGDAAEEAYDEAWRTAEEHGLSKDGLKSMAKDVGSKFASAAAGQESAPEASQASTSHGDSRSSQMGQPAGSVASKAPASPASSIQKPGASAGVGEVGSLQGAKRPGEQT